MKAITSSIPRRSALGFLILLLLLVFVLPKAAVGWLDAENMNTRRREHTSTLLPNGKVLVAGGYYSWVNLVYHAELYDPDTNTWTGTAEMNAFRNNHTAVLLNNGRVLISGGSGSSARQTCELYDPVTEQWTPTGDLNMSRFSHTMTRLMDGKVLVAGGYGNGMPTASTEIYDPDTGVWTEINPMNVARVFPTATLLPDGKVLVVAGMNYDDNHLDSAEIYDPLRVTGRLQAT